MLTFYRQWYEARTVPREFVFLRYESFHSNSVAALRRALEFLGATGIPDSTLSTAIAFASFDNLRDAESENRFGTPILAPASSADPETFKVRKGKVGGFRDYLTADDIAWIDAREAERGCEFTRPAT